SVMLIGCNLLQAGGEALKPYLGRSFRQLSTQMQDYLHSKPTRRLFRRWFEKNDVPATSDPFKSLLLGDMRVVSKNLAEQTGKSVSNARPETKTIAPVVPVVATPAATPAAAAPIVDNKKDPIDDDDDDDSRVDENSESELQPVHGVVGFSNAVGKTGAKMLPT